MPSRPRIGRPPGDASRYRAIAADLARRLASGEWPLGKPIPSYRRLARHYSAGLRAVRLALQELSADGRVLIRPRRPPQAALGRPLAAVLDKAIALVSTFGLNQLVDVAIGKALWRGLALGADELGWPLIVLQHPHRWRQEFPAGLRHLPLSGLILLGPFKADMLRQYEALRVPVVLVDQPGDALKLHSVAVDNYRAARDATARLIARGHRRIAFVRSLVNSVKDIDPDSRERQAGFIAACSSAGLKEKDFKVFTSQHQAGSTMREIVQTRPRFSAVFCVTGTHALQTAAAAEEAGMKIPQDLSIVTFQPSVESARNWSGPHINFERMGRTAVRLLQRKSAGPEHVRIPTVWKEGNTLAQVRVGRGTEA
ncbi:MAG: substrate-binding domain-containing protein [Planctomycetes bacterium]|nr:substrate-binding domain-containing protein [Planctomycetota bacterium]